MKQKLLIVALALGLAIPASAGARWGVDAGVNITKMSFDKSVFNSDNCAGLFIGPKVHLKLPLLGLGVDGAIRYSYRPVNVNATIETTGEEISRTKALHYIEVPVNVRWDFNLKIVGLYVATGPQWDWNVGDLSWSKSSDLGANITTNLERHTFFWNVGGGIELFSHLDIGFNYNIPLGTQGETKTFIGNVLTGVQSYQNGTWQIYLNYFF